MEKISSSLSFGQGLELAEIIIKAIDGAAKKTNADPDRVQAVIERSGVITQLVEKLFAEYGKAKGNSSILQVISGGEKLMIGALDGKEYVSSSQEVLRTYESYTHKDFEELGLDRPGPSTTETEVDVSEMVKDATFAQIFTGITSDLDKLVLTQAQIIRFCRQYRDWLRRDECKTFFLTKTGGEYFVVSVLEGGPIQLSVDRLKPNDDNIQYGECRHRVVAPQLMSEIE